MISPIAKKLLRWYAAQKRNLPWRADPQPYAVWVAEIMAQQTRLEAMLPYYARWMRLYPSIRALARSAEQDVLALWEGLGYYSRARNLRRAAKVVMTEYDGRLPSTVEELRRLPGIGAYTAGAIASLAFGADAPAVDGNAVRVLSRLFDVTEPASSAPAQKLFWALAAQHLPPGCGAAYNQALMDLGAQVCTPRQPRCGLCPLRAECRAATLGIQEQRPVKIRSQAPPRRNFVAAVVQQRGSVLVMQRPAAGLLAGMWEFPNAPLRNQRGAKAALRKELEQSLGLFLPFEERLGEFEHAYSHFSVRLQVFHHSLDGVRPKVNTKRNYRWLPIRQLDGLPMGRLDRRIADVLRAGIE
ncbi:MAG TPA: A/G-specific adenine glycosylase [Anaerolineales bacterium]|nr:A/G-specific adenine glycosylase [Anaerolineales bacterium]